MHLDRVCSWTAPRRRHAELCALLRLTGAPGLQHGWVDENMGCRRASFGIVQSDRRARGRRCEWQGHERARSGGFRVLLLKCVATLVTGYCCLLLPSS